MVTPIKSSATLKSASAKSNKVAKGDGSRFFMALAGAAVGSSVLLPEVATAQKKVTGQCPTGYNCN